MKRNLRLTILVFYGLVAVKSGIPEVVPRISRNNSEWAQQVGFYNVGNGACITGKAMPGFV
jgi:hypothetical protein